MRSTLQIVIPAFNESERLPRTIALLNDWLVANAREWDLDGVIVVDNASTDGTSDVARALDSEVVPITVVHCAQPGKGAAVRIGIHTTTSDRVAYLDADGATSFEALDHAMGLIDRGADIAIGSRAVAGSVTMVRHSRLREIGAAVYRWSTAKLVPDIRDTQCGFKVFRGPVARSLLAATRTDGFAFDVEVLRRAQLSGAAIAEFPVTWVDVPGSSFSTVRHGFGSFRQLANIAVMLSGRSAQAKAPLVTDCMLDA